MTGRVPILGVPIDPVTMDEAVTVLRALARSGISHHVMTPNPEMIVESVRNPEFLRLLQTTSLNVPDGVGLLLVSRILGTRIPERVTGTDLAERIASDADFQPVFFLGAAPGVAERAAEELRKRYPDLVVAGTYAGSPDVSEEPGIVQRIHGSHARTLLVAYGAPAQDLWIARVLPKLPAVRIAVGVGGAFDFFAGAQRRAPAFLRMVGLEWLWRLALEPRRFRRICTAVAVFPFLALTRRSPLRPRADIRTA